MTTTRLSDTVRVAVVLPFFRYAVGPTSQHNPAIPYFTFTAAKECFAYMVRIRNQAVDAGLRKKANTANPHNPHATRPANPPQPTTRA
jgi:hypothetical protein